MALKSIPELVTRRAMQLIAIALGAGRLETKVVGLDRVPQRGPAILVARHYHHLFDGVALYQIIPRHIHILVTLDWARNRFIRHFMETAIRLARWPVALRRDALSVGPDGTRHQKNSVFTAADVYRYQHKAMRDSVALLAEGKALVIFPEGYPNIDPNYTPKKSVEELLPFNAGFAAIVAAAEKKLGKGIPVIPVGIHYEQGTKWTAHLNFGTAVYATDFPSRAALVKHLEIEVAALSGMSSSRTKLRSN